MPESEPALDSAPLKAKALELGFDLVGVCPASAPPHWAAYSDWIDKGFHGEMAYLSDHLALKMHPERLLPGAKSIVAVGLNYFQEPELHPDEPKIARYALGRDYHKVIRGKLRRLETFIQSAEPDSQCRLCVDSAPILERDFAQLAGLGWYGKNTLLINSQRGSWFLIGLLLTTLELEPDPPAVGGCGTCRQCIDACPTGALVFEDDRWQLDARRCISYQTIEKGGDLEVDTAGWTFGCDICQEVCPFNQPRGSQPLRASVTLEPDFLARRSWPNLEQLAQVTDAEFDALTKGSAVRRAGAQGLRRNALANSRKR